ncbi:hypothetical protein PCH_Pc08g00030 [Penicillium rubens Wisconsin 54-1255]|uniref:Uncharacterized protein n=1 Tax=Penicillium rubens (strain ATCC 28089 / DSM 1075 / NRRL 1951 / Wisconsin 54-1255) TaxID=500485 RepID=B6GWJ5_PENRW|nr:hypothetical protein PCH_Pc08g00030 [Penicillium rubens Wisconsin 54-1255]
MPRGPFAGFYWPKVWAGHLAVSGRLIPALVGSMVEEQVPEECQKSARKVPRATYESRFVHSVMNHWPIYPDNTKAPGMHFALPGTGLIGYKRPGVAAAKAQTHLISKHPTGSLRVYHNGFKPRSVTAFALAAWASALLVISPRSS